MPSPLGHQRVDSALEQIGWSAEHATGFGRSTSLLGRFHPQGRPSTARICGAASSLDHEERKSAMHLCLLWKGPQSDSLKQEESKEHDSSGTLYLFESGAVLSSGGDPVGYPGGSSTGPETEKVIPIVKMRRNQELKLKAIARTGSQLRG